MASIVSSTCDVWLGSLKMAPSYLTGCELMVTVSTASGFNSRFMINHQWHVIKVASSKLFARQSTNEFAIDHRTEEEHLQRRLARKRSAKIQAYTEC